MRKLSRRLGCRFSTGDGGLGGESASVEGYERWEDNILVKFNEFLGFSTLGFES